MYRATRGQKFFLLIIEYEPIRSDSGARTMNFGVCSVLRTKRERKKIRALHNSKFGALDSIIATVQEDGELSAVQYLTSPLLPLN